MSIVGRLGWVLGTAGLAAAAPASTDLGYHVIPGSFAPGTGPDGNSVFLEAPEGLILVDTGRHPAHRDKLLAYAREKNRPIAAIVNTHWHLDHTTGNAELRAAYPEAEAHASRAIEGALTGFLRESREKSEAYLASGKATPEQAAEIRRGHAAVDNPEALRPTVPVTRSGEATIAGRTLQVNLAPYAVTEGDVWLFDERTGLLIAGDLVVGLVPFMDTACPEGWREALDAIAATPFTTLVPGHGEVMDRQAFLAWRAAYNGFLDCAASTASKEECVAGWQRDAAAFIPAGDERRVAEMATYYFDTRLRAASEERRHYCRST
jgi:glyoxylase-like metal-dependent hydrolase (beta-lactamase superfamily II)